MRKIIAIILISYCCSYYIKAQSSGWFFVNPLPTNETLNSIKFLNQNTALTIGYHGTLMRTSDAGLSWSNPLSTMALTGLENLHYFVLKFIDQNTGFIIGDNSGGITKLFKTTNMGITWTFVYQFAGLGRAMCFINQNTGWVGNSVQILKTTNGGLNWQNNTAAFPSGIISILFLNSTTGFATASNKIYKSTDGGNNWLLVNTSNGGDLNDLFFINSQTGFVAGAGCLILKTTNSGSTWTTKLSVNNGPLSSINFINSLTGFAVGGVYGPQPASIYKTTDEGETWNQVSISTTYHLNSIGFSGNIGISVGYGGRIARSTDLGSSWSVSYSFHTQYWGFKPMSFIDVNTGWISILGSTAPAPIYRTTNGGINWTILCTVPNYANWMQFLDANTGYYKSGMLFKSTNGGFNWTQLPPINITTASINFVDVNTGYACGYTSPPLWPRLVKTTNGGNTWDSIHVPPDYSVVSCFNFINDNTGWISIAYATYPMGSYGKIFRTTDHGQTWVFLRIDSNVNHKKISFINNLTGWVSTSDGNLLKSTNGGNSWINLPVSGFMYQFVDANMGWVIGYSGSIYKTINGGLNWFTQVDVGFQGAENMQFVNSQTGYLVGAEGLIIKTTNGGELIGLKNISSTLPKQFSLSQNYPNPFNPVTKIRFDIPSLTRRGAGVVVLKIYDILGRKVQTLVNEKLSPGTYEVEFNGSNFSSGVYYYTLSSGDYFETKRMVLVK